MAKAGWMRLRALANKVSVRLGGRLSLRSTYLLFTVGAVFVAAVGVGLLNYSWIEKLTLQRAVSKLEAQVQLIRPQIDLAYQRVRTDAQTVSRMPPFSGLARSIPNDGVDPRDGSTSALWRNRLETIFQSIMAARPEYLRMTYVGVGDRRREFVRVDRMADGGFQSAAAAALRRLDDPSFLSGASALAEGEVRLETDANEPLNGEVRYDQSVLRAVTPIFDERGELFGFLVISADYDVLLREILSAVESSADLFVITDTGDYLRRTPDGRIADLARPSEEASDMPARVAAAMRQSGDFAGVRTMDEGDLIVSAARTTLDARAGHSLTVALAEPRARVMADANKTRGWVSVLSGSIVLAASLLAFVISGRLTKPLHDIATAIKGYNPESGALPLPEHRQDEIGEISRAFSELVERKRRLRMAQVESSERLVRAEKMAALGNLVAGVAHELNTPMGVAVTTASTMSAQADSFQRAVDNGQLRRSELNDFIATQREGAEILLRALHRAADMVSHFKQVAVDQASEKRRAFALDAYVDELLESIRIGVKGSRVALALDLDSGLTMDSYPGPFGQVLINLVNNAVLHGFPEGRSGKVVISTRALDAETALLCVRDDGVGMDDVVLRRVFEPFFTTKWGSGGSGLGMSIVHNLVTGVLGGAIEVKSGPGEGVEFRITLPTQAPRPADAGPEPYVSAPDVERAEAGVPVG